MKRKRKNQWFNRERVTNLVRQAKEEISKTDNQNNLFEKQNCFQAGSIISLDGMNIII